MFLVILVVAALYAGARYQEVITIRDKYIWFGVGLAIVAIAMVVQFFLLYDRPACV